MLHFALSITWSRACRVISGCNSVGFSSLALDLFSSSPGHDLDSMGQAVEKVPLQDQDPSLSPLVLPSCLIPCSPRIPASRSNHWLSGPRQQQTVIEEVQVDGASVQLPSQRLGDAELQGRELSTLHQPAGLWNEREYLYGAGKRKKVASHTGHTWAFSQAGPSSPGLFLWHPSTNDDPFTSSFLLTAHPLKLCFSLEHLTTSVSWLLLAGSHVPSSRKWKMP